MLAITQDAADAITSIAESNELPEGSGLKVNATGGQEQPALKLSMERAPEAQDQVIEDGGARVFLEPAAASYLDDKVLHAQPGESGRITFVVHAA